MSLSTPFIRRPVATTLLTFGVAAAGVVAFLQLPVSPLPQVDFPTISVQAQLPGASPEIVATSVATPLERHLGQIADVSEMTSTSSVGSARITLQFGLDRDINGAARDVQAAINAARADLPTSLRSNPTYHKVNQADAPILILALTSDTLTRGAIYDAASTVMAQRLSQVEGIGEVTVGGASLPAVRVELTPQALFKYGIGLEDVRAALSSANAHSPKGALDVEDRHYQIYDNDQASKADQYRTLIVAYRNGAAVRLADVADVVDSVENLRNAGIANGKPSILVILYRQPNANIIDAVDRVVALLPQLQASISPAIDTAVAVDRSTTIRASLWEVERTLLISVGLVIMVVFLFLRNARATLVPTVAVPVSLTGTFAAMYFLGYSLDNLSLMALTIATGFVVDDAIVVLENITRHIEAGMPRMQAAIVGASEVGFTVLSMSLSLIAVFIPILLMGGIVGRLFREFAVTLSVAILISLAVSLATTPMMCAFLLRRESGARHGRLYRASERFFDGLLSRYERSLGWALDHPRSVVVVLLLTLCLNVYLFIIIPKGFFPQQDTGRLTGGIQADQSISFQLMQQKLMQFITIVKNDPAVSSAVGFTGGGQTNSGFVFVSLKPLSERSLSADQVIARLRGSLAQVPGDAVPAGGSGYSRRRPAEQFAISIHAACRRDFRSLRLGAESRCCAAAATHAHRRQLRPAEQGFGNRHRDRPGYRVSTRYQCQPDRQHPLRCVRAAPGIDHLQCTQPIPRDHGGGATVLAEPGHPQGRLCEHLGRIGGRRAVDERRCRHRGGPQAGFVGLRGRGRCGPQSGQQCSREHRPRRRFGRRGGGHQRRENGAAHRLQPLWSGQHAARGQSRRPVRRDHDLFQSGSERFAQ